MTPDLPTKEVTAAARSLHSLREASGLTAAERKVLEIYATEPVTQRDMAIAAALAAIDRLTGERNNQEDEKLAISLKCDRLERQRDAAVAVCHSIADAEADESMKASPQQSPRLDELAAVSRVAKTSYDRMIVAEARVKELEQSPRLVEWPAIESAPKDGTPVIIAAFEDGRWICRQDYWRKFDYGGEGWGGIAFAPTHWMPLPTPPGD